MTLEFGELRSLLHQPTKDAAWRKAIWALLDHAYSNDQTQYTTQWLPHLLDAPSTYWDTPLTHFRKLDDLERAHHIAPFALFQFSTRLTPLSKVLQTPGVHQLENLSMWMPEVQPGQIQSLIQNCDNLRALTLGSCGLSQELLRELVHTRPLTQLTYLNIQSNDLHTAEIETLASSNNLPALKKLILFENHLDHTSLQAMRGAPWLPQLTLLELSCNRLGPEGMEALLTMDTLTHLQDLSLERNNLRDEGCQILARSTNLTNLTTLDLSENSIEDDGLIALAQAQHLTGLQHLTLNQNHIDGEGLVALATAPFFTQLKSLTLHKSASRLIDYHHYSAFIKAAGAHAKQITISIDYDEPEWVFEFYDKHYTENFELLDFSTYDMDDADYELLCQHPKLREFKHIRFSDEGFTTSQLQTILDSGCLDDFEGLDLTEVTLPTNIASSLARIKNMKCFSFAGEQLNDDIWADIFHRVDWPHLQTLLIYNNTLTHRALEILNQSNLDALNELSFYGIQCTPSDLLQYLLDTPARHLKHLYIEESLPGIKPLTSSPRTDPLHIDELHLPGISIDDANIKQLTENLHNITIANLNLRWNDIGPHGAKLLADCPSLIKTTTLDLRGNPIGDEGLAAIIHSPHLVNLTTMYLTQTNISPAAFSGHEGITRPWREVSCHTPFDAHGFHALFDLCPDLESLTVYTHSHIAIDALATRHTTIQNLRLLGPLDESNIETLLSAPWLDRLKQLDLGDHPLTLKSAQNIAKCKALRNLESLNFPRATLTDEIQSTLKQSPYLGETIKLRLY